MASKEVAEAHIKTGTQIRAPISSYSIAQAEAAGSQHPLLLELWNESTYPISLDQDGNYHCATFRRTKEDDLSQRHQYLAGKDPYSTSCSHDPELHRSVFPQFIPG